MKKRNRVKMRIKPTLVMLIKRIKEEMVKTKKVLTVRS